MQEQNFQEKDRGVIQACLAWRKSHPKVSRKLNLLADTNRGALGTGSLDTLVSQTASCFSDREARILEASEEESHR